MISLAETSISGVLAYTEADDNFCFLRRDSALFVALEKFQIFEKDGKRFEAVLITENGKPSEKPRGIVTIWDLPKIYDALEKS